MPVAFETGTPNIENMPGVLDPQKWYQHRGLARIVA
jgi:hypothetical protein